MEKQSSSKKNINFFIFCSLIGLLIGVGMFFEQENLTTIFGVLLILYFMLKEIKKHINKNLQKIKNKENFKNLVSEGKIEDGSNWKLKNNHQIQEKKNALIIELNNRKISIETKISKIKNRKFEDILVYNRKIKKYEKNILKKGGDNVLFSFLKIETFLKYSQETVLKNIFDYEKLIFDYYKSRKGEEILKLIEEMPLLWDNKISYTNRLTIQATDMIDFYLNDDMIEYFKIYEVFEKNGVFDSTWQKNVSNQFKDINHSLNELINSIDY